jgi:transcriptional regulator with XRE-family HTH domain
MPEARVERGARVAQTRRRSGLSQQQLAAKIGVSRSAIARIEGGINSPTLDLALALAGELGESVESLFGGGA